MVAMARAEAETGLGPQTVTYYAMTALPVKIGANLPSLLRRLPSRLLNLPLLWRVRSRVAVSWQGAKLLQQQQQRLPLLLLTPLVPLVSRVQMTGQQPRR